MDDAALLELFATRRAARLRKGWGSWQPTNPNASDMADCRRYQVMRIIAWKVRRRPDVRGMEVIESGNVTEPAVLRQLEDEGWSVIEQQAPFSIEQPLPGGGRRRRIVSGKLDAKVRAPDGEVLPLEVKDTGEYVLDRVGDEAALLESPWTRKWWRQVQLYLLGEECERGVLFLTFRGRRKPIMVRLNYAAAEELLQLCAWTVGVVDEFVADRASHADVDERLAAMGVPYHHEFDACRRCPFRDLSCFPPEPSTRAAQVRIDLSDLAARFAELRPLSSEYERVRKALKAETEGFQQTVAGQHIIEGEVKTRHYQAKPATPERSSESWQITVRPIGEREGGETDGAG